MPEQFNCRKCGKVIGGHNQYLHDGMCDRCFFNEYFPDEVEIFEAGINKIRAMCRERERENLEFREFIKATEFDQERFNNIVTAVENRIDCTKCGNCCKLLPFRVTKEDVQRMAAHLKLPEEEFKRKHVIEKDGAYTLKQKPCIFLKDNKCTIYDVRPEDCRSYPYLKKDIAARTIQLLSNAEICPIAFNALENAKMIMWGGK